MDVNQIMLSQPVTSLDMQKLDRVVASLEQAEFDPADEQRKEVARNFEGILIHQLLDQMKDTIPESDLEDSSSKQVKSMYWSFLSDAVADRGGFGLWEKIYEQMRQTEGLDVAGGLAQGGLAQGSQPSEKLDTSI